jgi:ubiquinone/menaquinone biosynthesis C-methylase UbiE
VSNFTKYIYTYIDNNNRNYFSPVTKRLEEGINVLDSGCGPATWAFEMGETYPRSKFYGIDASCSFPEEIKPANVEFVIGNIAKEIPYEENFFDFIHQRLLILGLTDQDWTNVSSGSRKML